MSAAAPDDAPLGSSAREQGEQARARLVADLRAVNETAIELGISRGLPELYTVMAEKLGQATGAALVAVSSFRPRERELVVESVRTSPGLEAGLAELERLLDRPLAGLRIPLGPAEVDLLAHRFAATFTSLGEVSFGAIPPEADAAARRALDLGDLHAFALADESGPLATCVMAMRRDATPPSDELRAALGRVCGVALSRTRAELALHESRERLRAVFEGVTDGILLADIDEESLVMANPAICTMLGYTEEEILRLRVADVHPKEQWPVVREVFRRLAAGEQRLAPGLILRRKDGGTLVADVNGVPLRVGARRCLMGVFRDMTVFNQMEAQLLQARKMEAVGQLAGGIAHDFNNILGVMLGQCERMLRVLREDDPLVGSVRQIQSGGERAAGLVRQLLAFSRKQPLHPEVLDLNATVRSLEGLLRQLVGPDVELVTTLAIDLRPTRADPGQIEQVVVNLAANARDAMPRGGRLVLETTNASLGAHELSAGLVAQPGDYVVLRVTDSGAGMDERTRERIFEPFFTTKEQGRGTGLGLSTVYGIVAQSGGCVRVESEVGAGSKFEVFLPQADGAVPVAAARATAEPRRGRGELLLVVEDEPEMREMVRDILQDLGYRVHAAANGGEALLALEENRLEPDLLVTDVVMPGMGGTVLAAKLRLLRPGLRVLFMSGYTDERLRSHGALPHGVPFLEKPFRTADLAARVSELLASDGKDA